jgi:hypothetical protein
MTFYTAKSYASRGNDEYYTPHEAIIALKEVEAFKGTIVDPCCGDNRIVDMFHNSFGFDIKDGNNFLTMEGFQCGNVVTNPPYRFAQHFVEKALACAEFKVAMLLRLAFLEGQKRKKFFEKHPPKTVYVFSRRLNMKPERHEPDDCLVKCSGGTMAFAWFVWEKGFKGDTCIKWL